MPSETNLTEIDGAGRSRSTVPIQECHRYSTALSEAVDIGHTHDLSATTHFGSCLRCQAELAQYKKLLRALSNLRGQVLNPDEFLLHDILSALNQTGARRRHLPSLASRSDYVRGVGALVATACTAGAIVLASRLTARHRFAG